jgi:NAD(P)-dependent dehydrogenase (short-subunit alcohol dehydrogenase family)
MHSDRTYFHKRSEEKLKMPTVLITGTNRGLGLEFVRQYAADGWRVLATARDKENAKELNQLSAKQKNITAHALNVADDLSVRDLADQLGETPIDILIHNSGLYPRKGQKVGEIDYAGWREAMDTNLYGVMRVTEALLENVAASERRQIAAISSSMASLRAVQGGSVGSAGTSYQYRTSKTALNMAFSVLAKELEPRGISVVLLDPGWVKTDMGGQHAQLTPEQSITGMRKVLAGPPQEISGKFLGYDGLVRPW